ncbi:MAG: NPCBM/NEW2 domain-containing protein, partial [Phycisphaeraceae bacterium]|nr:NPCBM/NEW2 domain-containing protein [Phycisphaeraceae bacterium]
MRLVFVAGLFAVSLTPVWAQKAKKKSKAATKPVYTSPTITPATPGNSTKIKIDITGAKQLWLKVEDVDGKSSDHADWAEPRLIGPKGTKKLTDLKWIEASTGWGKIGINKSAAGSPMKIDGQPIPYGIGTHAPSLIGFQLPAGYTTFEARIGLDDSGAKQSGSKSSVKFLVYTARPKAARASGKGADYVPLELFQTHGDLEITLWATSPLFSNPTNMDIDYKGRVWVAEGRRYRKLARKFPEGDRIVVLEDTDQDGKADSSHVFVQEPALVAPLGVAVIDNKIIVSQPPDLIVYTDVDRNAKFDPSKDKRKVLLTGFAGKNHDHSLHSLTAGPSGQWYFNFGNKGAHVKDKEGWELKAGSPYSMRKVAGKPSSDGHVYLGGVALRVNPDGTGMRPIGHNFRNSYEQTVTSYGDVFQNDNDDPPAARTTWLMEYGNAGYASNDGKRSWRADKRWGQSTPIAEWRQEDPGSMPAGDFYGGGAPTGITYYESGPLGAKYRGLLLSCEPTRNTIFGYLPEPDGAGFKLERFIFLTTNPEGDFAGADFRRGKMGRLKTLFRPSDVTIGPDGAIYVADWFDARVGGHATHDKGQTGSIY